MRKIAYLRYRKWFNQATEAMLSNKGTQTLQVKLVSRIGERISKERLDFNAIPEVGMINAKLPNFG